MDSGSDLTCGDGLARKLVLLDAAQLRRRDQRKQMVMREAMRANSHQHKPLRQVLLATLSAERWHETGRGQPPARIHDLETIHERLGR